MARGPTPKTVYGERWQRFRLALNYETATDLAAALGYNEQTARNRERGTHQCDYEELRWLRDTYGLNPDFYMFGEGPVILPKRVKTG